VLADQGLLNLSYAVGLNGLLSVQAMGFGNGFVGDARMAAGGGPVGACSKRR